jgi:hypothetical protein
LQNLEQPGSHCGATGFAALLIAALIVPRAVAVEGRVQTSTGANPVGPTLTGTTTGIVTLQQKGWAKITCTKGSGKGEMTSETTGTGEEVSEGCQISTGGKCQTEEVESPEGIIKTGTSNLLVCSTGGTEIRYRRCIEVTFSQAVKFA